MGGIVAARDAIAGALTAALPANEYAVIPYARNIDPPRRPTVMVRIDRVIPSRAASGLWRVEGALVIVGAKTQGQSADDDLDNALADVLFALGNPAVASALTWTEATRGGYPDPDPTNPAYEVAVNTETVKGT